MRKKYRRAICDSLNYMILFLALPIIVIGYIGNGATWIAYNTIIPLMEWLKRNLRVYDWYED